MNIGEITIKGATRDEIVLIAHIDHPFQANDNLSSVAVAIAVGQELQKRTNLKHTIKILFLPETIGSIAYVWLREKRQTLSKVRAVLALEILGNENRLLIHKTFDPTHFVNYLSEWVAQKNGLKYEIVGFRNYIGSDELIFSDPVFHIPGTMIANWPYPEYHTHKDTPEIISEQALQKSKDYVLKWVTTLDRNFIPKRLWRGPLMRMEIGWFLGKKPEDIHLELLGYAINGEKSVIELAQSLNMDIDLALDYIEYLKAKGLVKQVYHNNHT